MPKFKSPSLFMPGNVGPDGCAIFFRVGLFQPISLSFEKIVLNGQVNSQVFVVLQLRHVPSNRLVTVCDLHLKAKVEWADKRDMQMKYILSRIKMYLRGINIFFNFKKHPLIMCGDFNGEPFEKFYASILNERGMGLRDAYPMINGTKQYTTVKFKEPNGAMIKRAIDYVFYNTHTLDVTGYLELPSEEDSFVYQQGLPNLAYSSDHLSLVCDFRFTNA